MKTKSVLLLVALVGVVSLASVGATNDRSACPVFEMQVDRLPNLHITRSGHAIFCVNGEPVVIGGHTSGFVPTATAEFFHDGEWHQQPLTYTHDQGVFIPMKSGKMIVAGGHEQPLGIGQSFPLEIWNPATQAFEGYGCLAQKRCFAQGLEMDSGVVIISGNWYADDDIECFDGGRQCRKVKNVAQHRSQPYMLRTAKDNAIIFSDHDNYGHTFDTVIIDRLRGEPFVEPLLQTWRPFFYHSCGHIQDGFIGDESRGEFAYLLLGVNADGQMALLKVEGEQFSLLPTTCPVPMCSEWGAISYFSTVIADREVQRAYIAGYGKDKGDHRLYVLCINYKTSPATLSLYYSNPQDSIGFYHPILTADGDLLMAGGTYVMESNNYTPSATSLLLRVSNRHPDVQDRAGSFWLWMLLALLVVMILIVILLGCRRKRPMVTENAENAEKTDSTDKTTANEALLQRICQLMDDEQLFLNSELKVADIASRLGTNVSYVSSCINQQKGCSFIQFVNAYRVEYAKQLLRRHPDKKVSEVWAVSGFANETSFFRTFKAMTGVTPSEWRAQID